MVEHDHQVTALAAGDEAVRAILKARLADNQVLDQALAQRIAARAQRSLAALSGTSVAPGASVPVPVFPEKQRGTDNRFGSGNETEAQLEARFGSGKETKAQLTARAATEFGGGKETKAQLAARAATEFGGGKETKAQLAARFGGGKETKAQLAARRKTNLRQVNPRKWSGQAVHAECGKMMVIDKLVTQPPHRPNHVQAWCRHCKKRQWVATVQLAVDLCD